MRLLALITVIFWASIATASGPIYIFNPKYFATSFNSEIGLTFFTGYIRSPRNGLVYDLDATQAYPQPLYTYAYPLFTFSYEPQLRLIEFGSSQSISLNVPGAMSLSLVDVVDPNGNRYDPSPEVFTGFFGSGTDTRDNFLGSGHAEIGALLAYNVGQNATIENSSPVGLNLAVGYNYIYAPLFMIDGEPRSEYRDHMAWGHIVGRVGIQFRQIGFSHMFGINQTRVTYTELANTFSSNVQTRIYQRFTMTIQLGK